jgi:hypothetical protein
VGQPCNPLLRQADRVQGHSELHRRPCLEKQKHKENNNNKNKHADVLKVLFKVIDL